MRESIAKDLMNISEVNSTWSAPIMPPSIVWYNDSLTSNTTTTNTTHSQDTSSSLSLTRRPTPTLVDIVQLLKAPSITNQCFLQQHLGYPKFYSCVFEGYTNSAQSIALLKNDILFAARKSGQHLVVRSSSNKK